MNKNIGNFKMTEEQLKYIRNKANEKDTPISFQVRGMLNEWYLKNKDRLDENDTNNLVNLNITLDEETEKIYNLFIVDMMNNLIR